MNALWASGNAVVKAARLESVLLGGSLPHLLKSRSLPGRSAFPNNISYVLLAVALGVMLCWMTIASWDAKRSMRLPRCWRHSAYHLYFLTRRRWRGKLKTIMTQNKKVALAQATQLKEVCLARRTSTRHVCVCLAKFSFYTSKTRAVNFGIK